MPFDIDGIRCFSPIKLKGKEMRKCGWTGEGGRSWGKGDWRDLRQIEPVGASSGAAMDTI